MSVKCPKCHSENPDTQSYCGDCGTQLTLAKETPVPTQTIEVPKEELTTGSTFAGRYQIIEELGKGGMGKVYRALDNKLNEEVALKLIKPEIASDKKTLERFQNELKLARKIRHSNVGGMYELLEDKGLHYITMEYVSGEDLKSFIRRSKQLSIPTVISIAKQICDGLSEAHKLGVVHRDLKPSNIMIDKDGNARIMDFGIARSLKGKGITGAGVMIGTPEYMSPEQVEGKDIDHRSDIYSLGVILYEMVTGQVPFDGETPLSIAHKHKYESPQEPNKINAQIPADSNSVILKCLEKDKEGRFQSAAEVRSELEKIEKGLPTTERLEPKKEPKTVKVGEIKLKNLLLYGGASILVIALVLLGIFLITGRQDKIDSIAVLPLKNLSGDPQQEYFVDGMTEALISKLTQIGALRVRSRTSVMKYKETFKSVPELSEELNVDVVVDGSVMRSDQRVQVRVQLIEARTDRNMWSNSFERDMSDVIDMQGDIAQEIAMQIKVKLTPQERQILEVPHKVNPVAYEAYLKGRHHWNKRTSEEILRSIEYFNQATNIDPIYAQAYAGLADSYVVLAEHNFFPSKDAFPKAKAAALKALDIKDNLGEAHITLAAIHKDYEWDWAAAEIEYKRGIKLNPNYPTGHQWYAEFLTVMGRHDEAVVEYQRALELDPLSPIIYTIGGAMIFRYSRQHDRAIEQLKKALDLDSNYIPAMQYLVENYIDKAMYEEAIVLIDKIETLSEGRTKMLSARARLNALMGKRDVALEILDDLKKMLKQKFISPVGIASIYIFLGDKEQAFEWLERGYEERSYSLIMIKVSPIYDTLKSDPRYTALLKKMNLN